MNSLAQKDFKLKGYYVARNVIHKSLIKKTQKNILESIKSCSKDLGVSEKDYLSAVSRWLSPSPITSAVSNAVLEHISQATQSLLDETSQLSKFNVICKNDQCRGAIPYHQDISYSPENPYQVSAWLALQDVPEDAGPLEVIPGSHKEPIKQAVDFWSPEYEPDSTLKNRALKLPLSAGDVVFFDSSLWHGSSENLARISRYAIVTRWVTQVWLPPQFIPRIQPRYFGMWTSGELTQQILSHGAYLLFQSQEKDFLRLLELWIDKLQQISLPFSIDLTSAIESLTRIRILHLAYLKHKGGDATGNLYKNLWKSFLSPLKNYVEIFEQKCEAL
ncbi:MAG: phytanoyl-CoA dioxygenase family protein [Alphaproteobacteria bacterium]|nr:phytanoyl-CoA dioxygenase family protein [Alphaproteobacteria bacterium]